MGRRPRCRSRFVRSAATRAAAVALAAAIASPAAARVVLVGVDGASWNLLDPMLAAGELPNLAALIARGASAEMETVEPVSSPVVWTSIATGRSPEAHGVTDFFATRLTIRVPSSFERLAGSGLRVGLYDYLVTWPPAALPGGFVVPGWLRRDGSVTPADVWERAGTSPYLIDYEDAFTSAHYLERAQRDVTEKASRWVALLRAFDLDVAAVTFYAVDMTSHRYWEAAFPDQFEDPAGGYADVERRAIGDALRGVDRSIGEIAAALGPEDLIVVASDHGFRADPEGGRDVWVTDVDPVLAAADLDPDRDGFSVVGRFGAVAVRVQPGETAARDETTQKLVDVLRSFNRPDGEPLFVTVEALDMAPRPPEAQRPLLDRVRQWIVKKVAQLAFDLSLDTTAHAIVIALPDRDLLASLQPDAAVRVGGRAMPLDGVLHHQRFTGTHDPTAVFIAAGGPVRPVDARGRLSVLDVSPLLFYAAGRPIPDDLEGRLPTEILRPDQLAKQPPAAVAARDVALPAGADEPQRGIEDPKLVEKLRALGYIE